MCGPARECRAGYPLTPEARRSFSENVMERERVRGINSGEKLLSDIDMP